MVRINNNYHIVRLGSVPDGPARLSTFRALSNLCWRSSNGSAVLELEYPRIALYAVSRDTAAFPHPCVYLQYLSQLSDREIDEEEEEEDEEEVIEYRLVPPSPENC